METLKYEHTPKVSIIIPAYNTAHLIADCLDSVFSQTYQHFEAIVVNDGSPDTCELETVLEPYLARIVHIKQENKGASGARNTAIRRARGEFLAFLDSDDSWFSDHLASQMRLFDEDPTLDLVYCNGLVVGDPRRPWKFMDKCPSHGTPTFQALISERCQIPVSTVVARKSVIVKAGLFDEAIPRCDDYDMWVRAAFHEAKIGYSRNVQVRLSGGRPGSLGQSGSRMAEAYWQILEKLMRTLPLDESARNLLRMRSVEVRAQYLLAEGKFQLSERRFSKARELLVEANQHLRSAKLSLALLGLKIAPRATAQLVSLWNQIPGHRA